MTKEKGAELLLTQQPVRGINSTLPLREQFGPEGHGIIQRDLDSDRDDESSIPDLVEIDASRVPIPEDERPAEARMAIENITYALPHGTLADAQE